MLPVTSDQILLFLILLFALILFIDGRIRYDIAALLSLCIATILGVVPWNQAFSGFANPAVITVAAVLVISRGLLNAGVVELISRWLETAGDRPTLQVSALTTLVIALSAFMNNVGALALLMPVGIRMARKSLVPVSILLLPLAFGSQLGGMITLIGTPPNLIISAFRQEHYGEPFGMFDFTPVGFSVAAVSCLFIALIGWRLIPRRTGPGSHENFFDITDYITEVFVPPGSRYADRPLRELMREVPVPLTIIQIVRGAASRPVPYLYERIKAGDILILQSGLEDLKKFLNKTGFSLMESHSDEREYPLEETGLMEATVSPASEAIGYTVQEIDLRRRFHVTLLAVARQGVLMSERLREIRILAGDVLLLQGAGGSLQEAVKTLGCFPLAERGLKIDQPRRVAESVGIFGTAIIIAAAGLVPVQIIFTLAAISMVILSLVPLREIYESIDWAVIILLGAFIPVGQAMETSGGAGLIASTLLGYQHFFSPVVLLVILLVVTMLLSAVINNAATAVLMAPVSTSIADGLSVSPDPFLMIIMVGASSAFLTPVGHQSNALVMGPAGLKFGDYWRLGLPLEILIAVIAVPVVLYFWPL